MPARIPFEQLQGQTYGDLTILSEVRYSQPRMMICACVCGNQWTGDLHSLRDGNTTTCGCSHGIRKKAVTHGEARAYGRTTPEYKIWSGIKKRCLNEKCKAYGHYGGRGITMYQPWVNDFPTFVAYVGRRPSARHSLDRFPNNDGNYEPDNVRWATQTQQARNTRANRKLTVDGETKSLAEWAADSPIPYRTILSRLNTGWDHKLALTTPSGPGGFGVHAR